MENINHIVQVLKALGDETRLKILIILSRKSICAKGIARHLNISEAAVSQHIRVLKDADIVVGEKVGYYVRYDLKESTLMKVSDFINLIHDEYSQTNFGIELHIPNECVGLCRQNKKGCMGKNIE